MEYAIIWFFLLFIFSSFWNLVFIGFLSRVKSNQYLLKNEKKPSGIFVIFFTSIVYGLIVGAFFNQWTLSVEKSWVKYILYFIGFITSIYHFAELTYEKNEQFVNALSIEYDKDRKFIVRSIFAIELIISICYYWALNNLVVKISY